MASTFVWHELMTPDGQASLRFYRSFTGWSGRDASRAGVTYAMLTKDGEDIAGMLPMPKRAIEAGAKPHWMPYIGVDNIDAAVTKATGLGGKLHMGPMEIADVGKFAVLSDPQGAAFQLFEGPARGGEVVGWHELITDDPQSAMAFYGEMFGWAERDPIEMGPNGTYRTFAIDGEEAVGGMMARPGPSAWLLYFKSPAVRRAAQAITDNGGKVLMPPLQLPNGSWVLVAQDPMGAIFGLVRQA